MLARLKFNIATLVNDMLDQIPQDILINGTVFDPAIAGGQFVREIEQRKRAAGKTEQEIRETVFGMEENILRRDYAVNKNKLVGAYEVGHFLTKDFKNMKFDIIIGNPPYQDGTKEGQQNKIYNQMSKKALGLLKSKGVMAFITPSSVCKKSKRFSIVGNKHLVSVNFTPNNHFDVGVNICYWIINKSVDSASCTVTSINGEAIEFPLGLIIYDHGVYDETIMKIKTAIKEYSIDPDIRMFLRNNPGPTKSKNKRGDFVYPLYNSNQVDITCYVKRMPYNYGKTKLVLSMTKALKRDMVIISDKDFDDSHVAVFVESTTQIENVQSFIFSDYFVNLANQWKLIDGYGFNEALKYIPMFDKNISWDNNSVKEFIEGFINK